MVAETHTMDLDPEAVGTALAVARTMSEYATVRMSSDGWYIRTASPDMTSLASMTVDMPGCPDGSFGLEIDRFAKAMRRCGPRPRLVLGDGALTLEGDGMRVRMPAEMPGEGRGDKSLDFDAMAVTTPGALLRLFSAVDPKHDFDVGLTVSREGLEWAMTDDTGMGTVMTQPADTLLALSPADTPQRAWYAPVKWVGILKALPADAPVTVSMSSDWPAEIVCTAGALNVRWMVAPRIREEGE